MTVVIISGANRGLGLGLVKAYALRPAHTVIAAVRTPSSMPTVETANYSKVVTIKVDASVAEDAAKGIEEIKAQGIDSIDIAFANAAIMGGPHALKSVALDVFEDHWRVNVLGALALYQAVYPLMPKGGKFIWLTSGAGTIDREQGTSFAAYGITKSSIHYLTRYTHLESPDLISIALAPGWAQTDSGNLGAKRAGLEKAPMTIDESVTNMMKVVDEATRENYSGKHVNHDGTFGKF